MQHEKLKKGIYFGYIANILFIAFGMICLFFYYTYSHGSIISVFLEFAAYTDEIVAFGLAVYSAWLLAKSIRGRKTLKISYTVYIIIEAVMMLVELNSYRLESYDAYSLGLAYVHSILSGIVCFSFLLLDPHNVKWEIAVGAGFTLCLAGMFGSVIGIRIYFSIILNAVGFAALFYMLRFFNDREEIEIDCYGDKAVEQVFSSSTLFAEKAEEISAADEASDEEEITAEENTAEENADETTAVQTEKTEE